MHNHTDTICPTCGCAPEQSWWRWPEGTWPRVSFVATRLAVISAFAMGVFLMAIGALVLGISIYLG